MYFMILKSLFIPIPTKLYSISNIPVPLPVGFIYNKKSADNFDMEKSCYLYFYFRKVRYFMFCFIN